MPSQSPQSPLLIEKIGDVDVVRFKLSAMVGHEMVRSVGDQIAALVEKTEHPHLLLDLSGVKFLTSLMLAKLTALNKKVQSADGRMVVYSVVPDVNQIFKLTYLDKVLNLYDDEPAALQSFTR